MCGIAGYIGSRAIDASIIKTTLDLMNRRGPDAKGHEILRAEGINTHLLHSRLSIIDLDPRANQPFQYKSRWIAYNGELYNYLELKASLEAKGHVFKTSSDTEVLMHVLDEYGFEGLDKCEGMWAFALYDEETRQLTLCRDRFGEKPLYLYRDGENGLYFGSEVKFIAGLLDRKLQPNLNHMFRYMVNGYRSLYKQPETFFHGVTELLPGEMLHIDTDLNLRRQRYWFPLMQQDSDMSWEAAISGAREKMLNAVDIRLRADVPLAFCMSGGVDSNSLISVAKREFDYDVHGFTIVNKDARYEEQDIVEASVKELGIKHTNIELSQDNFLENLRELIRYHDAPVYTVTYYAHWLLQKAISESGYRVSISGTSADEIFSGYYDHHSAYIAQMHREGQTLYQTAIENWQQHIKPIVRNPYLQDPDYLVKDPSGREHLYLDAKGFAEFLTHPWQEPFREEIYSHDLLRNRMANEVFHEITPVILHEDDLNAMYYSIENRSPFLDRQLFEFCHSIPTRHLINKGCAKAVLRESMRGIVPDIVLDERRKVGFNAPIFDLLDVHNNTVRSWLLDDAEIFDYVQRAKIEAILDQDNLKNSQSKFLFYFVTSKIFLEEYA